MFEDPDEIGDSWPHSYRLRSRREGPARRGRRNISESSSILSLYSNVDRLGKRVEPVLGRCTQELLGDILHDHITAAFTEYGFDPMGVFGDNCPFL